MCKELGDVGSEESLGSAHHSLGFQRLGTSGHDCGLNMERSKRIWGREDHCGSILQIRKDSTGTLNNKATVLACKQGD